MRHGVPRQELGEPEPSSGPAGGSRRGPDEAALSALGQAAAGVAHDFDNALTAIVSQAALIRATSAEPETIARAESILWACRGARDLVEHIRGALRPTPAERVRVDLAPLLAAVTATARVRAEARGVALTLAAHPPLAVAGHPGELEQAVLNLVHNAIDAARSAVSLSVNGEGEAIEIAVDDDGPGIPPHLREAVLTPFFTTRPRGTGLGLALATRTARAHGGELRLEARSPGTRACLRLPRLTEPLPGPRPLTDLDLATPDQGARVLVLDDDAATRDALCGLLATAGYLASAAADPREALTLFHAERPDLFLTDLDLGRGSALALIERLGALDPSVPIVVATGLVEAERPARLRRLVAEVFDKPLSPGRLLDAIKRLVAERRALLAQRAPHD